MYIKEAKIILALLSMFKELIISFFNCVYIFLCRVGCLGGSCLSNVATGILLEGHLSSHSSQNTFWMKLTVRESALERCEGQVNIREEEAAGY